MIRLGWMLLLVLLISVGCSRREKDTFPVVTADTDTEMGEERKKEEPGGQLVAQVVLDSIEYLVPRERYLQRFIREFGDGTVVDKAIIRKVQDNKRARPTYYLVGLGLYNGQYRSMAMELYVAEDNTLYMRRSTPKFICKGTNCDMCMFTFKDNKIIGCECEDATDRSICDYETGTNNQLFDYK